MKTCTKCRVEKPESAFRKRHDTHKLRAECRACLAARCKEWVKANGGYKSKWRREHPEQETAIRRRAERKRKYGLTDTAYQQMLIAQDNKCGICQQPFESTPNVDHCHVSGAIRGLLCRACNRGLGMFKDSREVLQHAVAYMERTTDWTTE